MKKKTLNGKKWSLLYQGSRHGFRSADFHFRCDNKPNTLTIVKSTGGNIFGGFTTVEWKSNESWKCDKSAFIFSLVNKENKTLLFEQASNNNDSIGLYVNFGPMFGAGNDILISDNSNMNTDSFSNLGFTYTHPEYTIGSEKAQAILAGSRNFQVQEIEVFQLHI